MRYYSDLLKKVFDSEEACVAAEDKYLTEMEEKDAREKELRETRKARAKEVEDALKAVHDAQKQYQEKLDAFLKDYKTFHCTLSATDVRNPLSTIFDDLFMLF